MEKKKLYLPHELIVEILVRLPVKSLICFKCVSKSWYSLISNPHFSNSHYQLTATHTRRIMCISVSPRQIRSIEFERFVNYDLDASLNINFWLPQTDFPIEIKGSCRGIIYLYCRPYIYLWNPSTGFKKQIHVSPFDTKRLLQHFKESDHIYGFGYDQSRDDYVVVVLSHEPTEEDPFSSHLEIFSIRDNKWKEIEGPHFPYHGPQAQGLLFNGAIHWFAFRPDFEIEVIVAFDLTERKLFEVPLPDVFHQHASIGSSLWKFGEFFSLWTTDYDNSTVEIWVMKEYKLSSSWTKTHVLPLDVNIDVDVYFNSICSTNNGDIIGTTPDSRLVKYNDKGQRLWHHSFCYGPSDVVIYTESLISLPSDNEKSIN